VGSRKNPVWRVVVADQRSPRDGRIIETVGRYNPQTEPSEIAIDRDRVRHWLERGAQPSGTVRKLLRSHGLSPTGADLPGGPATPGAAAPATSNGAGASPEAAVETPVTEQGASEATEKEPDVADAVAGPTGAAEPLVEDVTPEQERSPEDGPSTAEGEPTSSQPEERPPADGGQPTP
jgi:small subunit ribosomal protein S16